MCAAEVDRHVAQRYLLKRRLGKGVSPGKRLGVRGTRPPAGCGQGGWGFCSLRLHRDSWASVLPPPGTGGVALGKPPSRSVPRFPVTSPNGAYSQETCQVPGSERQVTARAPSDLRPSDPEAAPTASSLTTPCSCLPVPTERSGRLGPTAPVAGWGGQVWEGTEWVIGGDHGMGSRSVCEPTCTCDGE